MPRRRVTLDQIDPNAPVTLDSKGRRWRVRGHCVICGRALITWSAALTSGPSYCSHRVNPECRNEYSRRRYRESPGVRERQRDHARRYLEEHRRLAEYSRRQREWYGRVIWITADQIVKLSAVRSQPPG